MGAEGVIEATGGAAPRARLGFIDCLGIAINGIVGSGIFFLPGAVFRRAGGASPLAWLLVGGLCFVVALSFAEAARHTERSGGAYRFATIAFGPRVGVAVGWLAVASAVLAYAAVVRGLCEQVAVLAPSVTGHEPLVGAVLMGALAAANLAGLRPGARLSDVLSFAKLVPLVGFVAVGLFYVDWARLALPPAPAAGESTGLIAAAAAGLFACTGFEFVAVPAADTRDPGRAVPAAILAGLALALALYALIQLVVVGTSPDPAAAFPPLAASARAFAGGPGEAALILGATISAVGFCAGSAVVGPRFLAALAEDGLLPAALARRDARGVPRAAILTYVTASALSGLIGSFQQLAEISALAVVAQYLSTCLAVPLLRRKAGEPRRILVGVAIPLVGAAVSAGFLTQVSSTELRAGAALVVLGFVVRAVVVRMGRLER